MWVKDVFVWAFQELSDNVMELYLNDDERYLLLDDIIFLYSLEKSLKDDHQPLLDYEMLNQ
jgi:hypothetical protein